MTERSATEASRETLQQFRDTVAGTVGFVRSREVTHGYTSISIEELVDNRVARIEAAQTDTRPGDLARLEKIKNDFDAAIEAIKATPPDAFRTPDPDTDVNTPDTASST